MEGQFSYQDFDLLIEPGPPGSYRARCCVRRPGMRAGALHAAVFGAGAGKLRAQGRLGRRRTRGPGRPENAPLKDFGGRPHGAGFQDELRDVLQRSLSLTRAQQVGDAAAAGRYPGAGRAAVGSFSTPRGGTGSWPNRAA